MVSAVFLVKNETKQLCFVSFCLVQLMNVKSTQAVDNCPYRLPRGDEGRKIREAGVQLRCYALGKGAPSHGGAQQLLG